MSKTEKLIPSVKMLKPNHLCDLYQGCCSHYNILAYMSIQTEKLSPNTTPGKSLIVKSKDRASKKKVKF